MEWHIPGERRPLSRVTLVGRAREKRRKKKPVPRAWQEFIVSDSDEFKPSSCLFAVVDNSAMSSPRESGSPRDGRGKRDNGKPEMLLGKGIVPIHVPKTARPTSSRFQKYSDHLPDRYLSQMTPFSTPLYDARVHVARAKSHFKRKLHNLISIFVRVDKNQNGLIPRTEVRCCFVCTCTPRRAAAVPLRQGVPPAVCLRHARDAQGSAYRGGTRAARAP